MFDHVIVKEEIIREFFAGQPASAYLPPGYNWATITPIAAIPALRVAGPIPKPIERWRLIQGQVVVEPIP